MHKTKSSKTDSSIYSNSLSPNSHPQLAYRPFASQPPKVSSAAKTSTDIEDAAFAEQQMEATGLSIQAKYGTITSEGQERLTVLQAQMDGLLNSRLSHATRFGHNIANIPLLRPQTSTPIQAKLTIGEPGDKYEQEADETARLVVQRIHQSQGEKVQRESLLSDEELQMKPKRRIQRESLPLSEDELQMKPMVQRVADGGMATSPDLETSIQQARGSGQPLADRIKSPMEQAFGADFSGVKVHTDTQADQLNQSIQAKAFTTGQDVFFRQGAYEPGSRGGQELLAHELTHVVQQGGSTINHAPIQRKLYVGLEEGEKDSKLSSFQGILSALYNAGVEDGKLELKYQKEPSLHQWGGIQFEVTEGDNKKQGNDGTKLLSALINNPEKTLILYDDNQMKAIPQNTDKAEKGVKQDQVIVLIRPGATAVQLGHELIHTHHFYFDPWGSKDAEQEIPIKKPDGSIHQVKQEEARTVGLGKWAPGEIEAKGLITENTLRALLKIKPRTEYSEQTPSEDLIDNPESKTEIKESQSKLENEVETAIFNPSMRSQPDEEKERHRDNLGDADSSHYYRIISLESTLTKMASEQNREKDEVAWLMERVAKLSEIRQGL
ncbi:MAG: DUF4157 domain-containing protein [Nostoc sp.]|uniref:eCIS core domain-containing protein n=1 Tax=Nostoc sp. TaxID=1180 RepID=UPI002FF77F83